MIGSLSVLALIPARGGSKGLPGKNILPVNGRPLLAWTIEASLASRCVDRTVLSSDDEAIMQAARTCGCEVPFRRPAALATDSATSVAVAMHALDCLPDHDIVVLLQPTSPLRSAADIDTVCERLLEAGVPSCVSVSQVDQSPYWMYRLGADGALQPLLETLEGATRRQDFPPVYALNGAVYAARTKWLRQSLAFVGPGTVAHVMPRERSIDIDTPKDFEAFRRAVNRDVHEQISTSSAT